MSYLKGKVKHETPNAFGGPVETKLSYDLKSNHPSPIKHNPDESLDIAGGFIHAEAGANLDIQGLTILTPDGSIDFDNLNYSGTPFERDKIIFGEDTKLNFLVWSSDCIEICRETIELLRPQKPQNSMGPTSRYSQRPAHQVSPD